MDTIENLNLIDASGVFHRIGYFAAKYCDQEQSGQIALALRFVEEGRFLLQPSANTKTIWLLDSPDRTYWRSDFYPEYKSARPKTTQDCTKVQTRNLFMDEAKAHGYQYLVYKNFEADDLVGGVIRIIEKLQLPPTCQVNLVTADSDWHGLIGDKVRGLYPRNPFIRDKSVVYDILSQAWSKQSKTRRKAWDLPSFIDFDCQDIWHWKQAVGDRADNLKAGSSIGVFHLRSPSIDIVDEPDFKDAVLQAIKKASRYSCDLRVTQEYLSFLLEAPLPIINENNRH